MKVKFTMPKDSGLKADFNINKSNTIALKSELNAEIEARIEGDNNLQSEITRVENEIPDISGLATKAELQEVENEIPDISNLATKMELQAVENEIPDVSNLATKTELQEVENEIPVVNNGTLTIIQNGETKGVFRANDSNNVIVNLEADGGGAVNSVNGQTGDVVLTANDIGALPNTTTIPTKTSDLTNNSGFITNTVNNLTNYYLKSETYTKLEVQQLIASIPQFSVEVVQSLPVTGERMVLYLVPKDGEAPDVYNEYIWVEDEDEFELLGSTAVDLDGYATELWVQNQGYATETFVTSQGYITGITSSDVETALGYVPYNSSNPNGYITSADLPTNYVTTNTTQTITGAKTFANTTIIDLGATSGASLTVKGSGSSQAILLQRTNGATGTLEAGGSVVLFGSKTNHPLQIRVNYSTQMTINTDGSVILATAPDVSSNNNQVATTKWVNDKGYITGITSSDVTTALGYTPQTQLISGTNIKTINNISLLGSGNIDIQGGGGGTWGSITGSLSDQTDLQSALNAKLNTSDVTEYTAQEVETLWGSI